MLAFVPPKEEAKDLPRYASYVVSGGMKLHGSVGAAKNSFNNRGWTREENPDWDGKTYYTKYRAVTRRAFILENVKGNWYVLYDIPAGLTKNELPWVKEFITDNRWNTTQLVSDFNKSEYYKDIRDKEPERFRTFFKNVPMSRDEYIEWRLAVELESRGINE